MLKNNMESSDSDSDSGQGSGKQPNEGRSGHISIKRQREDKKQKKLRRQQKLLDEMDKASAQAKEASDAKKAKLEEKVEDPKPEPPKEPGPNGRPYSISIAVPGSILDNAQTPLLKTILAGQVARAAAIFKVDEIIVYDDNGGRSRRGCDMMAKILQFVECPQYLRKMFFPIHDDLTQVGIVPPLDIPHHLRRNEALPYREGVVSRKPVKDGKDVSLVDVGLDRHCHVACRLPRGIRVTIEFENDDPDYILQPRGKLRGKVVSPHYPRRQSGIYWGYTVRIALNLNKVISECPFADGYDMKLGTSEKGTDARLLEPKPFKHLLVVFGGVQGIEFGIENDDGLFNYESVNTIFDNYINTCPAQGARTIRTEEAILVSMAALTNFIEGKKLATD